MSLANQLTMLRLVAVVPVMITLYLPFEWARPWPSCCTWPRS